jgi:hypothetical protein
MRNANVSMCAAAVCTLTVTLSTPATADTVSLSNAGSVYQLINFAPGQVLSWDEAQSAAAQMIVGGKSGHHATLTSPDENLFVTQQFPQLAAGLVTFIGARQANATGVSTGWEWVTGETFMFSNWSPEEPEPNDCCLTESLEDGEENYAVLDEGLGPFGAEWNDVSSPYDAATGYLVEWDAAPVPEPGTLLLTGSTLLGAGFRSWRRYRNAAR